MRIFFPFLHHILIKDIFQHQCYYRKVLFIFLLPAYYLHYMNQWSRNVSYNFKHTCAHTQLMTFMAFVDPSSISCKNWLFLPPHKDISSYFSINIILVIFYHFAWVNFHQLIIRECGKRERESPFYISNHSISPTTLFFCNICLMNSRKRSNVLRSTNSFHFSSQFTSSSFESIFGCDEERMMKMYNFY